MSQSRAERLLPADELSRGGGCSKKLLDAINMAQWLMRTTVDIPDRVYRQLKSRAAREGSSTRALILRGVKNVLKGERSKAGSPVSLPIVRSKRPGTVALDNAAIYDVAFP